MTNQKDKPSSEKVTPVDVTGRQYGSTPPQESSSTSQTASATTAAPGSTKTEAHPELHAFEVGEVVHEGYSVGTDRQHHDITVPPRTAVHVAPGVTIHLHRDHPTDVTVMHTSELTKLIDGAKSSAD